RKFNPRQTIVGVALMACAMLAGAALPASAQVQSRMRVLVPSFVNAEGESTKNGERLAERVREEINEMPTHAPVEEDDWEDALDQYELDEDEMNCIKWRQLAAQSDLAQLVLCGTLDETTGAVTASFHPLAGGDAFDVPQFAFVSPEESAGQVVDAFGTYVRQISLVLYCDENIRSQNWQNALDLCNQAVELNPKSVSAHYARGSALMNMDRNEEALEAYQRVLEIEPLNTDAMLAAGILASKLDRDDLSQQYFREYLELNPGDENVRLSIAHDLANAGDPAGALRLVEEAAISPDASAAMLEYSGHFAMNAGLEALQGGPMNGNTDQANAFFEKALQFYNRSVEMKGDSADPTVLRNMMLAYKNVGNEAQALALGARATAASEDGQTWLVYSDVLREAGRTEEAIAAMDRAAQLDPDLPGIAFRKAVMLFGEGQLDQAVAAVKAGLASNSLPADQAENLAQQMAVRGYNVIQDGNPEGAMRFFAAAREIGKSERTIGMINFFNGYALVRQADAILREATTAAPARRAMPMLQRAKVLLEGAAAYTEQAAQRATLLQNVNDYIAMAQALIDMG
ncbi:MAG TPA: tetratricopeptide repeat protein, partial [Longimicrobiales bacterium]|nr:tetratricopeptide repeat protein [Longimicrobiales bacterium]